MGSDVLSAPMQPTATLTLSPTRLVAASSRPTHAIVPQRAPRETESVKRRVRLWLVIAVRVILAIAAALLLVLEVLLQLGRYQDPQWLPIAIVGVVAIGALTTNLIGVFRAATERRRYATRTRIYKACVAAAAVAATLTHINMLTIGVSVFRVKRHIAIRRHIWPFHRKRVLHRVERFRMNDLPQPSTVAWDSGKGAIGRCLATHRPQYKDWSPIVAAFHGNPQFTEHDFEQLPDDDRSGFTYEEFLGIVDKYAEIAAVPIMSVGGSSIVGVLAIDRPYDAALTAPVFNTDDVRDAAETAAVAIVDDVPSAPILDP